MMTKTFEVGKKYTTGNHIYECKYVGQKNSFLEAECGSTALPMNYMLNPTYGWKEFKEPVIEEKTLYLRVNRDGHIYVSHEKEPSIYAAREYGIKKLGSFKVTVTDGELTNVEIVK